MQLSWLKQISREERAALAEVVKTNKLVFSDEADYQQMLTALSNPLRRKAKVPHGRHSRVRVLHETV